MSPEERAREIVDKNCNDLGWAHRCKIEPAIASALAQARAEAFAEAAGAAKVPVLDPRKSEDWHAGYIDGQTTSIAAIREKAKP